ncbi:MULTISPECIES: hypothetical protein [unclassified Microcoleus]|uniref:hypothetical protein n=1 Tax=unclassified Microcoleus TaxID=2642155 RepID=UPI002FD144B7
MQITPEIISQFALDFMGKWPEKLRDETRTIDNLSVGDLVSGWQKLERFFYAVGFHALVSFFEGYIKN